MTGFLSPFKSTSEAVMFADIHHYCILYEANEFVKVCIWSLYSAEDPNLAVSFNGQARVFQYLPNIHSCKESVLY